MNNIKVGMTASDVIVEIVRGNEKIKILNFVSYRPSINVKEGNDFSLPRIGYHNFSCDEMFLTRTEILNEQIPKLIKSLPKDWALSIISRTEVDGEIYHLPLIDFCCEKTTENLINSYEIIASYLNLLSGAVFLASGRSYHFYSSLLLNEKRWFQIMGLCLLFDGYIDKRWVGHRLTDGFGCLRISTSSIRTTIPTVIEYPLS